MSFIGFWHITKMEMWDEDYIHMEVPTSYLLIIARGWLIWVIFLSALAASMLTACYQSENDPEEIKSGLSRDDVTRILGDPREVNEFVMPDGPFFGPQEGLTGLVPPGQLIEEWVYYTDGDARYVWFWGEPDQEREAWRVILTSVYPKDAVY